MTGDRTTFADIKDGPIVLSSLQALPRSVLLHPLSAGGSDLDEASLLVGLADGTLVTASIKQKKLLDRRVERIRDDIEV